MKCSACKIFISSKDHYKSEIHIENTKRKVLNIPPVEEISMEDIIIEEDTKKSNKKKNERILIKKEKQKLAPNECYFCPQIFENKEGLFRHLHSHLEIDEYLFEFYNERIMNLECIFCNNKYKEGFKLKEHLNKYLVDFQTNGPYRYLDGGKMIGNKEYMKYFQQTLKPVEEKKKEYTIVKVDVPKKDIRLRNQDTKNDLKVSIMMNHQKHFREHWLQ